MCSWKAIRELLAVFAACGLLMPPSFVAAQTPVVSELATPVTHVTAKDVALDDGGFLQGVVVDDGGNPQSDVLMYVVKDGVIAGTTSTGTAGEFQLKLERGGSYNLLVGNRAMSLRCWTALTAPPKAARSTDDCR